MSHGSEYYEDFIFSWNIVFLAKFIPVDFSILTLGLLNIEIVKWSVSINDDVHLFVESVLLNLQE